MTRDEHLYLRIAGVIEHQIAHAVLKIGERLPSVRVLRRSVTQRFENSSTSSPDRLGWTRASSSSRSCATFTAGS